MEYLHRYCIHIRESAKPFPAQVADYHVKRIYDRTPVYTFLPPAINAENLRELYYRDPYDAWGARKSLVRKPFPVCWRWLYVLDILTAFEGDVSFGLYLRIYLFLSSKIFLTTHVFKILRVLFWFPCYCA